MRLFPLLAVLLAFPARAQVVPITGRVSAPISGVSAGAHQAPGAGLTFTPDAGTFLPPALTASFLGAPAIVSREAAAIQASPAAAAVAAVETKAQAITAAALTPAALTPAAVTPAGVALDAAPSAASKDSGDDKNDATRSGPKNAKPGSGPRNDVPASVPKHGELEDGSSMFDGAAKKPNKPVVAVDPRDPTPEEIEAAFGPTRKPLKTFLKKFGIAGGLLAANTIAYAAVPNDGTDTGTLAHLAFDSKQFLSAVHDLSFSGLAESAWRALTSMFMHANDGHIFGNMSMLLLFAPWVQSAFGARRAMVIYLAGGVVATISYSLLGPAGLMLGASAAISALMGAALTVWTKPKNGEPFDLYRVCFQAFAAVLIALEVKNLILQGPVTPDHVVTLAHVVGAGVGLIIGGLYALGQARRNARERAS